MSMGHRTYLEGKPKGDHSMYGKWERGEGVIDPCPARPARHGESYTALSPVLGGCYGHPEVTNAYTPQCPLSVSHVMTQGRCRATTIIRGQTFRPARPGNSTNGT